MRTRGSERSIEQPIVKFDLKEALRALKGEDAWRARPRNAVTLVKEDRLRVVLVGLHQGTNVDPHRAEEPISIHLLEGAVRATVAGEEIDLAPGQVLALRAGIEHALYAAQESAFLLTIGGQP
jgi:quercetin dioxygenase-like cupin family protein